MTAPAPTGPLGWSFLVARGRTVGYRCLLAPDFLVATHRQGIITDAVTGEALDAGGAGAEVTTFLVAGTGPVTLAYRVRQVTDTDIHGSGDAPAREHQQEEAGTHGLVTDEHGRPLEILYGFLCITPGVPHVDDLDLLVACTEALRTYRRFLTDEASFAVEPSRAFSVRSSMSVTPAPVTAEPVPEPMSGPLAIGGRDRGRPAPLGRPRAVSILAALLVGGLASVVWMALGAVRPVTDVDVEEPEPMSADCTRPVDIVFNGTVTTRRSTQVTYRWEGTHNTDVHPHQLTFEGPDAERVSTTLVVEGGPGQEITGEQRLVVDEPNRRADSVGFVVHCAG